jgi:hypothetical protein
VTVDATQNNPAVPAVPPGMRVAHPQDYRVELKSLPTWVRPEILYWYPAWLSIRDACAGERQVKALRTYYLPTLEGMEQGEYDSFLARSTYFNFSARTVSAMSGAVFRRQPLIENVPKDIEPGLRSIARDRTDFETFASGACEEVITVGRFGVLLDLPPVETKTVAPFFVAYTAENILDWDEGLDEEGRTVPVRIVLREVNDGRDVATNARRAYVRYRELVLLPDATGRPAYTQFVYATLNADAELNDNFRSQPVVPLRRGEPLRFIPFQLFGPHTSSWRVEKPPMEDISLLNLSHYRSYAYLEHGRFFAGFPIYTAEEPQGGGDVDYRLGSSRVWVVPTGGTSKILELNGQGLKFLENALAQKESQAVSLGGKMLGTSAITSKGVDQLALEESNEQSVLLKTTRQLDRGFTQLLRWWAWWQGQAQEVADKIEVTFNKDFLFDKAGAREFRAVHAMYMDGVLPVDVLFYYMKKGYVIPDWMTLEEFTRLLNKTSSFPGQPDAEARAEGFKTKQQQLTHQEKEDGIDIQQQEIDMQKEGQRIAAKAAEAAAKAPPAPPIAGPQPVPKVPGPTVTQPSVKPSGRA